MITSTVSGTFAGVTSAISEKSNFISRFFTWSANQADNRFIWLGVILLGHASFFTPFTVMAVVFNGNSFPLIMTSLGAMGLTVITNLAALPTKITIPAFVLSIIIDIAVIAIAIAL